MSPQQIEAVPIAVSANETFAKPLAIMLRSLGSNLLHDEFVEVNVISTSRRPIWWSSLLRATETFNFRLELHYISPALFQGLPLDDRVSQDTYSRLFLEEMLGNYEHVLYLDGDMIVQHSIHELWRECPDDTLLCAVPHALPASSRFDGARGIPNFAKLAIPGHTRTFNAGVMKMNLRMFRKENISKRILKYLRDYKEGVLWWDQDGLNVLAHNRWHAIDQKWNVMTSHFGQMSSWTESAISCSQFESAISTPYIIHYSSHPKPWHASYHGLYADLYIEHLTKLEAAYPSLW